MKPGVNFHPHPNEQTLPWGLQLRGSSFWNRSPKNELVFLSRRALVLHFGSTLLLQDRTPVVPAPMLRSGLGVERTALFPVPFSGDEQQDYKEHHLLNSSKHAARTWALPRLECQYPPQPDQLVHKDATENGLGEMSLGFVSHSSSLLVGEENFLRTQFFGKQRARNMSAMNAGSF